MIDRGTAGRRNQILGAFQKQIGWCESLGSPVTARVLSVLAHDIAADGNTARLADAWTGDPVADALPLRFAGALHALVLSGTEPGLASCYPPQDNPAASALLAAVLAAVEERSAFIRDFLQSPPQTNEVGRSGVLLGGFLRIAEATGLPLHLLEIGASAGLNLLWDHYRYRLGAAEWGDAASPVLLAPAWQGPLPPLAAPLSVVERHACDRAPIDLEDPAQRLRLRAYVWADQRDRLARLEGAIGMARGAGQIVERADAASWVEARLDKLTEGRTTVLFHSVMWQYMPETARAAITHTVLHAGDLATATSPLAWLRFEPAHAEAKPELHLTLWPGVREHRLAIAHPHGSAIAWLGS